MSENCLGPRTTNISANPPPLTGLFPPERKTNMVRIIGIEGSYRIVSGNQTVGFAASYSLALLICGQRGWKVIR